MKILYGLNLITNCLNTYKIFSKIKMAHTTFAEMFDIMYASFVQICNVNALYDLCVARSEDSCSKFYRNAVFLGM